jgi:hypothetical protein
MIKPNRRTVLRLMGMQLALPIFTGVSANELRAAAAPRTKYIAGYFPNGAYMPEGVNGSWTWADALQPLAEHQQNTMVLRGMQNGFNGIDPHWQNCTGFLSCKPIQLGDPGVARCAKTVDQYVADKHVSPLRSLEIGGLYYHIHPLNDHPGYSNDYLNRISWQSEDKFRSPVADPARLFERLFSESAEGAERLKYLRERKQSVLDSMYKDAERLSARLPESYRPVLGSYLETVRELELQVSADQGGCAGAGLTAPTEDFSTPNKNYVLRFQLMHRMIVLAMQCGQTNVASIMYGPAVSEDLNFPEALGGGAGHHACAHHGGTEANATRLKAITRIQTGLLADLLTRLKAANLMSDTLVIYGSDMSDGNVHLTKNLPMLLCGQGADLKLGQEIGSAETARPLSDLHMEVFKLMGVDAITSFGEGECLSTGRPLGILA